MLSAAASIRGEGTITLAHLFRTIVLICCSLVATTALRAQAVPPDLLLRNVRILDLSGSEPAVTPGMAVLVSQGRIAKVGATQAIEAPSGARVIDGGGRLLMPGLVDMHVHLWDRAALGAYLAHGVTTIRNASGMPFHLRLADGIAKGEIVGPRLITTGPILNGPGPNEQLNHQFVESREEARAAVRAQHAAGFRRIKVYSNLSRDAYEGVRDEARTLGMTIMGHSPEGVREPGMPRERPFNIAFEDLLDDGFVTFEHIETIVWHALRDRHDEAAARRLADRIAAAGAPVDPTLLAFYNLLRVAETRGGYLSRPGVRTLNPLIVAQEGANYERWSNEQVEPNRAAFAFYQRATKIFADAGVLLVAGSDAGIFTNIPGQSLIDELDLLVGAGLSPFEALRAGSWNAARVLDDPEQGGRIAPGYRADLLLLDADPLADVRAAGRPFAVVAGGHFHDRAALDAMLEAAEAPDLERTQRNIVEGLLAQGSDVSALQP